MRNWQPFEWIVASRFLREGRWQTVFIIGGVAIGVAVIVFMSALLTGLQANFIRRVLTAQSHIQLLPPQQTARPLRGGQPGLVEDAIVQAPLQRLKSIDQWQAIAAQIRAMPEVLVVSPSATGSALVVRGEASRATSVVGIEPQLYFRIVTLPDKMVRGGTRLNAGDILIGVDLASDLGLGVGDKLRVTAASGADSVFTVSGIFDLGNKGANQRTTYMALHGAQSLLGLQGGISSLDVTVADIYAAEDVAQRITARTGVEADSWIKTNAQFFSAVQAQITANTAIRFFVGLSVAFGIASVLFVSVVQKSREIGILRAMGVTRGRVLRLFLLQGGLLGLAGSAVGSSIGAVALLLWRRLALGPDGLPLVPVTLEAVLFVAALLLATVTGLLAAVAPALRAARLDPVVAIRG
ncbi:ABC transporter permease [Roseateles saccharophilus]|uniref:Lipoprotein-releasing system permease protein n=1 Tax=Roseateles saccharophilus TaxID=304 RepID=A0A4R3UKQ5_ROSSA|nr:ABC transporter permease [Roseateles saccharophilus]MDG0834302.1 ABC transporter permease [Roseateles saccharophilus]TCU90668.1 lipoprotein-releasing system permease protein [Roseateles saccharophilus]